VRSHHTRLRQWLILAPVIFLTGASCVGEDVPDDTAAPTAEVTTDVGLLEDIDACALLTVDEIRSTTGHDPGSGANPVGTISGAAPICAWPSADATLGQVAQLLVSYANADTFEEYRQAMTQPGGTAFSQIDGPGRFTVLLNELGMVQSFGDRFMVQVMVSPAEGRDTIAAATSLAAAALARLE
jgi:hypothetical protein